MYVRTGSGLKLVSASLPPLAGDAAHAWAAFTENRRDYGRVKFGNCHPTNVGDLVAGGFA